MTEQTDKMDFEQPVKNQASPGEILRKARQAKNLSHIDVAKHLKLRAQWIVDIENDHYEDASSLIYVRGYLRSYARMLDLNDEKILEIFNAMEFDEPFKSRKSTSPGDEQFVMQQSMLSYSKAKTSAGKKFTRWLGLLVLLVIIVLVVLWWRGQRVQPVQNSVKTPDVALLNKMEPLTTASSIVALPAKHITPHSKT